ncbi:hypothetical protein B0T24DRAFT_663270 [Lasiosphaeria ovina]|uniref:Uncharacterized protein n=1 Tax=Lasiosphaeria ovina TaxID=92902 RepID=A0AAE0KM33_9PEZI|nr:hypothetical protein B0T24DRAFT_663270 [Lasiosphaeria ovina]
MKNRPVLRHFTAGLAAGLAAATFLIFWGAAAASDFGPSEEAARHNGFHIFNAVHSALRQWGSLLNYNGLSLFLATVPNDVLLYHSDNDGQARSVYDDGDEEPYEYPGYLQIYRVIKPLRILYVEGMGAGKTTLGTLDTQDFILRNSQSDHPTRDYECGKDLIELVSMRQRPALADPGSKDYFGVSGLEYMRAVSQRYHGIGSGRAVLDFPSMVSALFYPVNLTNPDPERPDLLRLAGATENQLQAIRLRVAEVVEARGRDTPASSIDWQGVADIIVARYTDRLKSMADKIKSLDAMRGAVNQLLNLHIDYPPGSRKDIGKVELERCTKYDTALLILQIPEDRLILAGIEYVTSSICSALFSARKLVVVDPDADAASLSATVKII